MHNQKRESECTKRGRDGNKRKLSISVIPVITKAKDRSKKVRKLATKGAYMYRGAQKKIISGVIRGAEGEKGEERERMIKAVP